MASEPKYIMIKNKLKQHILEGGYAVDSKIPSESELKDMFSVSRHTVRQSISDLVNEGYLKTEQGSGTYVSNQYQLKTKDTSQKIIGVITTYLSDYIFPSIIRGIEDELSKKGYALLLSSTQNNREYEKNSLEMMLERNIDGLIVEPTKSAELSPNLNYYLRMQERGIPYVFINASYGELEAPVISMNDTLASEKLTSHLLELGHTRISMITKTDDLQGKDRMKGFIKAHSKSNQTMDSRLMITFDTENIKELSEKIDHLLQLENFPTAFVCYNDQIAIKVIDHILDIGKKIPRDISIVSHDNSFLSTATDTKLTSIDHPKEKLGRDAANWIMQAIEKNSFNQQSIIYEPDLIKRTSTSKNIIE
ncbi:arabinose metabolism transcriptional repressor [Carnobacterium sp. 17-4]|uniref:GntR family transcriptional regulator n=1 Tax=Carnobacterium sp. (strain 17-4) TaxID=208596 RepID=UPI0002058FDA|nr:GntR family transcriptional regulator [Carnobacterium sp. 17-4]AEB30861.1 arabinose metabolism transcriptional repressor [Carnobacterium sp. 17-4]